MTTEVLIQGEIRNSTGTSAAREIRNNDKVPGVIYGKSREPIHVTLPAKEVNNLANTCELKTRPVQIELAGKKHKVLPREVNLHPVTDKVEHIDFLFLNEKEKIRVDVPVYYSNQDKSQGIKRGGALNAVFRNIKVEANADKIPEFLEVDLADTIVGDVIRFKDINFPEGVTPIEKKMEVTVAKVVGKRSLALELESEKTEGEGEEAEGEATEEKAEAK